MATTYDAQTKTDVAGSTTPVPLSGHLTANGQGQEGIGVGSPLWWLYRLVSRLQADQPAMEKAQSYYSGDHPCPFVPRELEAEYREMLDRSRSNFMRMVVDSKVERMRVLGIRLGSAMGAAEDTDAWLMWQENHLDAELEIALTASMVKGRSYLSVWDGDDHPIIAVEDPMETFVEYEPGNPRRRAAAVKCWLDDWTGTERANVYLPSGIHKFRKSGSRGYTRWEELGDEYVKNPTGVVPIIPIANRPAESRYGVSELSDVMLVQDRINEGIFNRQFAGWMAAYRQKWATGIEIPKDPESGQPVEPFQSAIDRLWATENENARFGSFDATPLDGYLKGSEQDVDHIAIQTATPRHYLIQQGQSPSGDAMKSAEAALVARVRSKMRHADEALEETVRLARQFAGISSPPDSEIRWDDPEFRVESERVDAALKKHQMGIPLRYILEDLPGYTTSDIDRILAARDEEQLLTAALTATGTDPAELADEPEP